MDLIRPNSLYRNILNASQYLGIVFSTYWYGDQTNTGSVYLIDEDSDGKLRSELLEDDSVLCSVLNEHNLWPNNDNIIAFLNLTSRPMAVHILTEYEPDYSDTYYEWDCDEDDEDCYDDHDTAPDGSFDPDDEYLVEMMQHVLEGDIEGDDWDE